MVFIETLSLHAYRNYRDVSLPTLGSGFVVVTGANGAGKTNILEAVSLLSPGRGLRGAKLSQLRNQSMPPHALWSISAQVESTVGSVRIGTGAKDQQDKRVIRVNGVDLKVQSDLADYINCIWLTPQMDSLFIDGASERRRFFDRLVFAFDPAHAGRVTRYETALSERARLLRDEHTFGRRADPQWLTSIEASLAATGVSIAAARNHALDHLQAHMAAILSGTGYPVPAMSLDGMVERDLRSQAALAVEDALRAALLDSRAHDAQVGGARIGPHKTDIVVLYAQKNMPAALCSTGEQKALLMSIILAHAVRAADIRGFPPILLLDEVAAHLDAGRREALFSIVRGLGGQAWITGTDIDMFAHVPQARHLTVDNQNVRER